MVSCLTLLPDEKGFISGSWDGSIREWDLNTGQVVRQYPTHGAQISSLELRPDYPASPLPSPSTLRDDGDVEDEKNVLDGISISVNLQSEKAPERNGDPTQEGDQAKTPPVHGNDEEGDKGDAAMSPAASPFDPLFDDEDADGETVIPSGDVTMAPTPAINDLNPPSPPKSGLALPGKAANHEPTSSTFPSAAPSSSSTPLFNLPQPIASTSRTAASGIPLLTSTEFKQFSDDILLSSSMDGQIVLIDRRVNDAGRGIGRLQTSEKTPPWCMSSCWLSDGKQVLAGRRNGMLDIWDVRKFSSPNSPNLLKSLRTPLESGFLSCVTAIKDGRHVVTASQDNLRLWNTADVFNEEENMKRKSSRPPFKIIAGHHGGTISSMRKCLLGIFFRRLKLMLDVDPTCRFLTTASGDRGWQGEATKMVLIHEIKW